MPPHEQRGWPRSRHGLDVWARTRHGPPLSVGPGSGTASATTGLGNPTSWASVYEPPTGDCMKIRWQNFRSYRDTGWIDLKPLTIVIGSNNTGKTSLYAPLLMLKQTDDSPYATSALLLRG